mgnify:CR=1 FL=1
MLDEYEDTMASQMIEEIMKEPDALKKYQNKKKLKKKAKKLQLKYQVDKGIIEESIAKQYLKMICNCIYKKVDETDDKKKEIAYKSFWALALVIGQLFSRLMGDPSPTLLRSKSRHAAIILFLSFCVLVTCHKA